MNRFILERGIEMKRLIAVVVFGVMLMSNICSAEMVYDNGTSLWTGASGFAGSSGSYYVRADDFTLSQDATVNGASVDLWLNSDTFTSDGMNWWIFDDNSGNPGGIIAHGTSLNPSATLSGTQPISSSTKFWELYFDLGTDVSLTENTTYWFGMGLIDSSEGILWSNSELIGIGYNDAESLNGTFDNWTHNSNPYNDCAFELHGNVVPVPGAFLLGMLGLSVAGMKLRKHA